MSHRGPFQPLLFCDSVILYIYMKKMKVKPVNLYFSHITPEIIMTFSRLCKEIENSPFLLETKQYSLKLWEDFCWFDW